MTAFTWRPVKLLEFDHHGNVMVLCTEDKKVVVYGMLLGGCILERGKHCTCTLQNYMHV